MAFPPIGKPFAARQCHIFTIRDGQHGDHNAVRDDLAMMTQLSHFPPSPAVAVRIARFAVTGGRSRAVRDVLRVAQKAAGGATAHRRRGRGALTSRTKPQSYSV